MKDTPTLSIYENPPDAEYSGWSPVICVLEKIDSMLGRHGNFSKMKMAELYPWLVYCIHAVDPENTNDPRFILLNRDYKPLGFVEDPAGMYYRLNYEAFTHAHVTLSLAQASYLRGLQVDLGTASSCISLGTYRYWISCEGDQPYSLNALSHGTTKRQVRIYADRMRKLLAMG